MKVVEKTKHILCSVPLFRKSCRLGDNVEKCGGAREATNGNMAHARFMLDKQGYRRTRACTCSRVRASTPTHARTLMQKQIWKYVILVFHSSNCFANALQCYVIRTLLVLLRLLAALRFLSPLFCHLVFPFALRLGCYRFFVMKYKPRLVTSIAKFPSLRREIVTPMPALSQATLYGTQTFSDSKHHCNPGAPF
jgi:hypothetical protein